MRKALFLLLAAALSCGKDSSGPPPPPPPPASGTLVVNPPGVGFETTPGGPNPAPLNMAVTHTGDTLRNLRTAIAYPQYAPTGWLDASLSTTKTPSTLTLTATAGAVPPGIHSAILSISADGATNGPIVIEVVFVLLSPAIYVSTDDPQALDDATCGTRPAGFGGHPCRTIAQGLARASLVGRDTILVADGLYNEGVTLTPGKHLRGAYQPDTWERHPLTSNTVIQGSSALGVHRAAVVASGITTASEIDGFVIRGPLNPSTGGNAYTIYAASSNANLAIRHNVIFGGRGGAGAAGGSGGNGAAGTNGGDRASDTASYDVRIAAGTGPCNTINNRSLANGGVAVFATDVVSGGNGGGNTCPPSGLLVQQSAANGLAGQAGAGPGGGAAGSGGSGGPDAVDSMAVGGTELCRVPAAPLDGTNGGNGGAGAHGTAVSGSSGADFVSGGHWSAPAASAGNAGGNGGGGGGGGAGGGSLCKACANGKDRLGGHGGGGASGGAGGEAGGAGGNAGAAVAVFVTGTAAPVVTDNIVIRGDGGVGGNGGAAGAGGGGGTGGRGGFSITTTICAGTGGRGGDGGAGGHGSGGGGGSGGGSYAFYTGGVGTPTYCQAGSNNPISGGSAGAGGSGGASLVNPGGAGQAGTLGTCVFR